MGCLKLSILENQGASCELKKYTDKNRVRPLAEELTSNESDLKEQRAYFYGFGGMEKDESVRGRGNSYTTLFRQYDPRIGRWLTLDPLMGMFPSISPYVAYANNPIYYIDPYGLSPGKGDEGDEKEPVKKGDTFIGDDGKEYTTTAGETQVKSPEGALEAFKKKQAENTKPGWLKKILNVMKKSFYYLDELAQPGNGDFSGIVKTGNPLVKEGAKGQQGSAIHSKNRGKSIEVSYFGVGKAGQTSFSFPKNWGDIAKNWAKAFKNIVNAHREFKNLVNKDTPMIGKVNANDIKMKIYQNYDKEIGVGAKKIPHNNIGTGVFTIDSIYYNPSTGKTRTKQILWGVERKDSIFEWEPGGKNKKSYAK